MIDPSNGLQQLFEAMAQDVVNEALPSTSGGNAPAPDTIGTGTQPGGSSTFLDAALADHGLGQAPAPGAGLSGAAGATPGGIVVPAALLASVGGDGDATSAALARLLGAASGEAATADAASEAAVAKVLAEARATGTLADERTTTALALLLTRGDANAAAGSPPLARLLTLLRAALTAGPGGAGAAARADLENYVRGRPAEAEAAGTAARAAVTTGTASALPSSVLVPGALANVERPAERASERVERATELATREAVVPVPERDARGVPYDAAARARLAQLGRDPRHGFAPEATAALEAERELGVEFERAGANSDYVDAGGALWNVVTPREAFGFEGILRAFASRANAIVTFKALAPDQFAPASAVAARLANEPGLFRILVVEGESS